MEMLNVFYEIFSFYLFFFHTIHPDQILPSLKSLWYYLKIFISFKIYFPELF